MRRCVACSFLDFRQNSFMLLRDMNSACNPWWNGGFGSLQYPLYARYSGSLDVDPLATQRVPTPRNAGNGHGGVWAP